MLRTLLIVALVCCASSAGGVTGHVIKTDFQPCGSAKRVTCIVDGDTFWLDGTKIRIADINTPEVSRPSCEAERKLGQRATKRMQGLLNQAAFDIQAYSRDEDRYGRKLRIVSRGGKSLGDQLVREGLAEHWTGKRRNWC